MDSYTPKVHKGRSNSVYVEMLLQGLVCDCCGKTMILKYTSDISRIFPAYYRLGLNEQLKAANIVLESTCVDENNQPICTECAESGKATFICAHCHTKRSTALIQDHFGEPAEYLCTPCYETLSAKEYNNAYGDLTRKHARDFE